MAVTVISLTVWAMATDLDLNTTTVDMAGIMEEVEMDLYPSELVTGVVVQTVARITTSQRMLIASAAEPAVQRLCRWLTTRTPTRHPWLRHQTSVLHLLLAQWAILQALLLTEQALKLLALALHLLNHIPTALVCTLVWLPPVKAFLRWAVWLQGTLLPTCRSTHSDLLPKLRSAVLRILLRVAHLRTGSTVMSLALIHSRSCQLVSVNSAWEMKIRTLDVMADLNNLPKVLHKHLVEDPPGRLSISWLMTLGTGPTAN